jgi:parallel beta-helix repeat protein
LNKRITSILLVVLLITGGFLAFILYKPEIVRADTIIYVGSGPGNHTNSIQDAIDNYASPGDTVYVYGEIYHEKVVVNKTINLTGEDRETTVIDGNGIGDVIYVNVDWVNITGFTATNGSTTPNHAGVELNNVQNCSVTNNNLSSNNQLGIYLISSSNNNIKGNIVSSNTNNGIQLSFSSQNSITNNNISSNAVGISLNLASNNTITNNSVSNNGEGIRVHESPNNHIINNNLSYNGEKGIIILDSSDNIFTNNNFANEGIFIIGNNLQHFNSHTISPNNLVNGKPVYYYKDRSDISIDGIPVGELILANCTNIKIKNLQISNTTVGIEIAYSSNILIANNKVSSVKPIAHGPNLYGIYLYSSSDNTITNNDVFTNENGIGLESSSDNNIIINNNLSNNYYGISIGSSFSNRITNNNLSSNIHAGILIGTHWMDNSSKNIVSGNNISNNSCGVFLFWVTDNKITGNKISKNNYGILVRNASYNIIIVNNIFNCEYGLYVYQSSNSNVITGNVVLNNGNGSYLESSDSNKITGNTISNNGNGILLESSNYNIFTNNNISWNDYDGIHINKSSLHNNIINNDISFNLRGIKISPLSRWNTIRNNNVSNNDYGIYITSTYYNEIYHNNLIDNTNQAYDNTDNANYWDNGYPSGGNFWSDYTGIDLNSTPSQDVPPPDGIGDTPYVIDSDSQDNYPLMDPVINSMYLFEGWNLISIPSIQIEANLGGVLSSISDSYDAVQYYDVTDPSDLWKHNHTSKPEHMNDLDDIDHTMGFWIHITEPGGVIFKYPGIKPSVNQSIPLHPGWNLVGYPSLSNKPRDTALNNIIFGTDVDAVQTYNAATGTWEVLGPSDEFELGRGYWVHSKVEKVWVVPL